MVSINTIGNIFGNKSGNVSPQFRVQPCARLAMDGYNSVIKGWGKTTMSSASLLYTSHFLSTWNSRAFQFGSVLLLAARFPNTLFPVSFYALVSVVPGALYASRFGDYIDNNDRLMVVRNSIIGQRFAVIVACAVFVCPLTQFHPYWVLIILSLLGGMENGWNIVNTVSVERDWVVVVAGSDSEQLRRLNSTMRFIDLMCKLLGPFAVGIIDSAYGPVITALVILGMSTLSCAVEYYAIARVFNAVPELASKSHLYLQTQSQIEEQQQHQRQQQRQLQNQHNQEEEPLLPPTHQKFSFWKHPLMPVSIAATCLYVTVLSFSGQMITFLVATGMSTATVTWFRTGSVVVELSTTVIAPAVIGFLGPMRSAASFIDFQWTVLLITSILFVHFKQITVPAAFALSLGVAISRIGLWGFDLSTQIIIQEGIRESERGKYSTTEKSLQNWALILVYISTMVFHRPDQFVWPVLISVAAVGVAAVTFNYFYFLKTH